MAKKTKDEETAIVATGVTDLAELDYGEDSGRGFENQDGSDSSLPFMKLLQAGSPDLEKLDKAKPGMWLDTATQQLYDREEGFLFVPGTTRHVFAEWVPREMGGGFRGHHEIDSKTVTEAIVRAKEGNAKFGKYRTPDGNQLTETFYVYGALCTVEFAVSPAVIAFTSTKIKHYKQWNTRLRGLTIPTSRGLVRPPMFANLTRIASFKDKNNLGEFYVPRISSADPRGMKESLLKPTDERFLLAKQVAEMVNANAANIDYAKQGGTEDAAGDDGGDKTFM